MKSSAAPRNLDNYFDLLWRSVPGLQARRERDERLRRENPAVAHAVGLFKHVKPATKALPAPAPKSSSTGVTSMNTPVARKTTALAPGREVALRRLNDRIDAERDNFKPTFRELQLASAIVEGVARGMGDGIREELDELRAELNEVRAELRPAAAPRPHVGRYGGPGTLIKYGTMHPPAGADARGMMVLPGDYLVR